MIRYSLACACQHTFEGWFASSSAFDEQSARGLVVCPMCNGTSVSKALMAPAIGSTRQNRQDVGQGEVAPVAPTPVDVAQPVALLSEREQALRSAIKALREEVVKSAEDVGPRFAEEARKIHYGERDATSIYGQASLDEAVSLAEEGVAFLPLPVLAEDTN